MARTFAVRAKLDITHMFDVDSSVGANAVNKRQDVLLVQYLLAVWMAYNKDPQIMPIIINAPVVKADGICGNKTKGAIKAFEKAFPQTAPDGKVDPFSTPTLKVNKIFLLNQMLFFAGGLRGGIPPTGIDFPQELVTSLFRP